MKEVPKFVKYRFREFGLFLQSKKKKTDRLENHQQSYYGQPSRHREACDRDVSKKRLERMFSQRKQGTR